MSEAPAHTVVTDPTYGYRRLDPVPDEAELAEQGLGRQVQALLRAGD